MSQSTIAISGKLTFKDRDPGWGVGGRGCAGDRGEVL